jgi:hypothetical protein
MSTFMRPSRAAFAAGLIGLGILGFVCGSSTATIAAAVWLVADTYHGVPWLAVRQTARAA